MPTRHTSVRRATAVALTAMAAIAAGGVASAQIPGENRATQVFPVDDRRVQLAVQGPDAATGSVSGSIQNNTDSNLTCTGVDGSPAGTVTRDTIVAQSVDFYAKFPYSPLQPFTLVVQGPGFDDQVFDLGSAVGFAPASLAQMLWPDLAAMSPIAQSYDAARLAGQAVSMGTSLSVPARTSQPFTVQLPRPSVGGWQDFSTGVFVTCVLEGQRYVFHGYENGRPAVIPDPSGDTGRFPGS
ncbi:hypothetical protein [Dietzia psychralcaliphila]|nr:hypothetical protein [Dietzia psychralcaliphila]PTM83820.1 hypothetical protein C8N39_11525 [Dietzia psychralcaliphila]